MATIQEYNAPGAQSIVRPSETGEQSTVRAGVMGERRAAVVGDTYARAIGGVGRAIGEGTDQIGKMVEAHLTQTDINKQGADGIALINNLGKQFNDLEKTADPNDPTVYQNFYDKVAQPAIQKWQEGFRTTEGQHWGMQEAQRYMEHMQNTVTAGAGVAAANATMLNWQKAIENGVEAVSHSPDSLGVVGASLDSQFEAALKNPNLTAEARAKLQEAFPKLKSQVGESAFYARMAVNPGAALAELKGGVFDSWHLDTGRLTELATDRAREMQERASADAYRNFEMQRAMRADASQRTAGNWLAGNTMLDQNTGRLMLGPDAGKNYMQIKDHLLPADQLRLGEALDRNYNKSIEPVDEGDIKETLLKGIEGGKPDIDKDIELAIVGKHLTERTGAELRDLATNSNLAPLLKDPSVGDSYRGSIQTIAKALKLDANDYMGNASAALGDNSGAALAMQKARTDMLAAIARAPSREAAMTLLDPTSPNSFISPAKIATYKAMALQFQVRVNNPVVQSKQSYIWNPNLSPAENAANIAALPDDATLGEPASAPANPGPAINILQMKNMLNNSVPTGY